MKTVITYGTYDLLHYGHISLLKRAKALGDYLIVGITSDDYDKSRGKINVSQSLMERIAQVKQTGLADEIIVEEYEGQKIDDIKRYGVDIFTVGSDWEGKFDYLNEYCTVVYLERTKGISSSDLRTEKRNINLGLVGDSIIIDKFLRESKYVNGLSVTGIYSQEKERIYDNEITMFTSFEELLDKVDAVYLSTYPPEHYNQIKMALNNGIHVLCEAPIALSKDECGELFELAKQKNLILLQGTKTAYSTAYNRLLLLVKSGKIGEVISVDSTCTSLIDINEIDEKSLCWNSICTWGPTAMLPVMQILGVNYKKHQIVSKLHEKNSLYDLFTKIDFTYDNAVASIKVGKGVKSEGELIISGTKGYIYVPAPWWKTDYFEVRYENFNDNKRHFYQLDGEGIRYELVEFLRAIENNKESEYIKNDISLKISDIISEFYVGNIEKI